MTASSATYKVFSPAGDCRRVTFKSAPQFEQINEIVDTLVDTPSSACTLYYIDSEGDRVLISTTHDIAEATQDTVGSGHANTVKFYVALTPAPDKSSHADTSGSNAAAKRGCPWGPRLSRRPAACKRFSRCAGPWSHMAFYGRPPRVFQFTDTADSDAVSIFGELADDLAKIFPDFFISRARESNQKTKSCKSACGEETSHSAHDASSDSTAGSAAAAAPKTAQSSDTSNSPSKADDTAASPRDSSHADSLAEESSVPRDHIDTRSDAGSDRDALSGFVKVEAPAATLTNPHSSKAPISDADVAEQTSNDQVAQTGKDEDDKVRLLREMGFALPESAARNMIREMGGRMDLIVRALVANSVGK